MLLSPINSRCEYAPTSSYLRALRHDIYLTATTYKIFYKCYQNETCVCNGLLSTSEDDFGIRWIARFCKLFGRHQDFIKSFFSSEIIHIARAHDLTAYSLTRNVRNQPSFVVHMNLEVPVWFIESIWICVFKLMTKRIN